MNKIKLFLIDLDNFLFSKYINKGSLLSLLYGDKEVSLDYINNEYYNELKGFLEKQDILNFDFSFLDEKEFIVYFSLHKDILNDFKYKFEEYISGNNSNIKFIGKTLGFPECCVNTFYHFYENVSIFDMKYSMFDFLRGIYNNSNEFNKNLDIFKENRIIFHTPCNFNCEKSNNIALNSINVIKNYKYIYDNNSYGYLYFNTNDFIRLDSDGKYLSEDVYYEYNNKGNREIFNYYKDKILNNLGVFDFENIESKNVFFIKFR